MPQQQGDQHTAVTVRILCSQSAGKHRSSFIDSEQSAASGLLFPVVIVSRYLDGALTIFPCEIFPTGDFSHVRGLSIGLVCFVTLSLARCPKQWAVSHEFSCIYSFLWLCRAPFHVLHLTLHTTALRETAEIKQNHSCTQAGIPGCLLPAFLTISYCPLGPLSPEQKNLFQKMKLNLQKDYSCQCK